MIKYEKITINEEEVIKRDNGDGTISWIPVNESNPDYQRYLNPEAEQSTPSLENGTIS
jgi:hypothetical protein